MDRRRFVKTSTLSLLASAAYLPAYNQSSSLPIIDTHQHLWDLDLLPLQWVSPPLDQNFVMKDYLSATKGLNVTKAVYMEVGAPVAYKRKEAEWALSLCKDPANPTVGAVISADPGDSQFQSSLGQMIENPHLKGIRHPFGTSEDILQSQVIENIRFLGSKGLSFDLNVSPKLLSQSGSLIDRCPDTRFVLNHCGNADPVAFFNGQAEVPRAPRHQPEQWYRDLEDLAQRNNIICKISGLVDNVLDYDLNASHLAPIINHCFDVFGPDRVIFASDWPVCLRNMSLAKWVETLNQVVAQRSLADRKKLFYQNANIFYGLGN